MSQMTDDNYDYANNNYANTLIFARSSLHIILLGWNDLFIKPFSLNFELEEKRSKINLRHNSCFSVNDYDYTFLR